MKTRSLIRSILTQLWLPVLVFLGLVLVTASSTSLYFPPLTDVLKTLVDQLVHGTLFSDLLFSLRNVLIGLMLAIVLGVMAGFLVGENRALRVATQPFLDLARATPMVAFIPVIILTFGIDSSPKIFLITLGATWPILLNTVSGVQGVSPAIRETARAYRIPRVKRLWRILLPGAMPQILAGIRIAVSVSVVMMIVSEIYGSPHGLGHFVLSSGSSFAVKDTWAGTLLIGILGYLMTVAVIVVEYVVLGWYNQRPPRSRRSRTRVAPASATS